MNKERPGFTGFNLPTTGNTAPWPQRLPRWRQDPPSWYIAYQKEVKPDPDQDILEEQITLTPRK